MADIKLRIVCAALPVALVAVLLISSFATSVKADDDEKDPFWSKEMDAPPDVSPVLLAESKLAIFPYHQAHQPSSAGGCITDLRTGLPRWCENAG